MLVKLQIKDDEGRTTTVSLTRDEYTVGRKEGNTIRLTAENVSRTHAKLVKKGTEVHVEDLSRYGTRVNGERIKSTRRVQDGDEIAIGDYMLSVEGAAAIAGDGAAAAAPKEASPEAPAPESDLAPAKPLTPEQDKAAKAKIAEAKAKVSEAKPVESTSVVSAIKDEPGAADEARTSRGKGRRRIESAHPMLVAVTSQLAGTAYPITTETMILGRTGENDLQVEHHSISRNHAKIVVADGRVKMVDLASKNGIRVNGEFWEESVLKSGDIIELGKVQFRFVEKDEDFIFRPEDWVDGAFAGGAAAAAEAPPKKKGKGLILAALVLLVGGVAAIYFLVLAEPSVPNVPNPTAGVTVTPPPETTTPPPETTATPPPETAPTVVEQQDNSEAINEAMEKAKAAIAAEKWDEAEQHIQVVMAIDRENPAGKRLRAQVASERAAGEAYQAAQAAQTAGDLEAAWAELVKVDELPEDSVYAARINELKSVVIPAMANQLVDQANEALDKKRYTEALELAEQAIKIQPGNTEAEVAKVKANRGIRAAAAPPTRPPTTRQPTTKPPETTPPPSTKSGRELYQDARAVHNSDPQAALKLYSESAKKGYSTAYRQIGILQTSLGNNGAAVTAYKRYLSLNPGARDSDVIRDAIVRLGGTP